MREAVTAWAARRNAAIHTVDWQFTTDEPASNSAVSTQRLTHDRPLWPFPHPRWRDLVVRGRRAHDTLWRPKRAGLRLRHLKRLTGDVRNQRAES